MVEAKHNFDEESRWFSLCSTEDQLTCLPASSDSNSTPSTVTHSKQTTMRGVSWKSLQTGREVAATSLLTGAQACWNAAYMRSKSNMGSRSFCIDPNLAGDVLVTMMTGRAVSC